MDNWLSTPLIVIATIAAISTVLGIGMWIGSVNSDRSRFGEFMKEVRDDIKEILSRLPSKVTDTGSPIRLTELGEQIAKDIRAEEWAALLYESLIPKVQGKTAYEVQELCLDYATSELKLSAAETRLVEQSAYENGVSVRSVRRVLGITLRDKILENQKE